MVTAAGGGAFGTPVRKKTKRGRRRHGEIPRLHWADAAVPSYLREGRPLILTGGCPLAAQLVPEWSLEGLAERLGESDTPDWPVHFTPPGVRRVNRTYCLLYTSPSPRD